MKKIFTYYFIATLSCISLNVHSADDQPGSPLQRLGNLCSAVRKGAQNALGLRGPEYCVSASEGTPQLYCNLMTQTELIMPEQRSGKDVAHKELLKLEQFQNDLVRCQKRAWFDFQHALSSVQNNEPKFVQQLLSTNTVFMSPLLTFFLHKYVELEDIQRKNSGANCLVPIHHKQQRGYLEWAMRPFSEENLTSKQLQQIIDDTKNEIIVDGYYSKVTRWVEKFDYERYLLALEERKKSLAVYQRFLAQVLVAFRTGKSTGAATERNELAYLARNPEFVEVYNQVWARSNALIATYLSLLKPDPSMDACRTYEFHWQNTPPLLALLISDIIHENKQTQRANVPQEFTHAKELGQQPIGKYIYLLVQSLNDDQRKALMKNKDAILQQIKNKDLENDNIAHNIHAYIKHLSKNNYQLKLLMPIAQAQEVKQIFSSLEAPHIPFGELSLNLNPTASNTSAALYPSIVDANSASLSSSSLTELRGPLTLALDLAGNTDEEGSYEEID